MKNSLKNKTKLNKTRKNLRNKHKKGGEKSLQCELYSTEEIEEGTKSWKDTHDYILAELTE